jgi:hypothetical protein
MTVFHLQLTKNEQTFTSPENFLNKEYEIELIKTDGKLETKPQNDLKQTLNVEL